MVYTIRIMKSSPSSANSFVPLVLLVVAVVAFGFILNRLDNVQEPSVDTSQDVIATE